MVTIVRATDSPKNLFSRSSCESPPLYIAVVVFPATLSDKNRQPTESRGSGGVHSRNRCQFHRVFSPARMYRAHRSKEEGVLVPASHSSDGNTTWKPAPTQVYFLQQR